MLLQADTTLDNATLALAIVTGILALGTIGTAIAALWQARSTAASVRLQREELEAVKTQLDLGQKQFNVARQSARPLLEASIQGITPEASNIQVIYAGGTEPAFHVWAWCLIATPDNRLIRQGGQLMGAMTASRSPEMMAVRPLTGDEPDHGLFAELAEPRIALLENESWAAVTWRAADGTKGRWGYVVRRRAGKKELIWDE